MADSANYRPGSNERLAREKLLAMTTNAGVVIGKVRDVGKVSLRRPRGRKFVTIVAGKAFMLF